MRKKWMFTFLIGMCIGIVAANLFCDAYKDQVMILSTYLLQKYPIVETDGARLFQYCIQIRLMPILYIGIFSLTIFGSWYITGYLVWLGFSFGALLSAATLRFGLRGILLCLAGMFPQFLIYVPVMAAAMYCGIRFNKKPSSLIRYGLVFCILFIVSIIGVCFESYVNPIILKKVLQLF